MYIERVQIEEGFLDGLDVSFAPGLNVIIGARGTGKSSLLELIRFCLDSKNYSEETKKRSYDHAVSVLGGGQITITLRDGDYKVIVSRTVDHNKPDSTGTYSKPLVFSQSEIESVGLEPSGRLKILDGFTKDNEKLKTLTDQAVSVIKSLSSDISDVKKNVELLEAQLSEISSIEEKIKALKPKEKEVASFSADANKKSEELETLSKKLTAFAVETDQINRFQEDLQTFQNSLDRAVSNIPKYTQASKNDASKLEILIAKLNLISGDLHKIRAGVSGVRKEADEIFNKINIDRQKLNEKSRTLRSSIEDLQKGAGSIIRESQKLKERIAQLEALKVRVEQNKETLKNLFEKRAEQLDILEQYRLSKFEERSRAEQHINALLEPQIKIEVIQSGLIENYTAIIMDALKGSGLQYRSLAPQIAEHIAPRELLELVDEIDADGLSNIAGINPERATKILIALSDADLGDIATAHIEDIVSFKLLDGGDYKDFSELSTGQRCTVILPLILEHKDKIVLIDQPEDHIDNAFITNTLIKAILRRANKGQMILTTHNANIPVLGDADKVIQMSSDGNRGYVEEAGELSDPSIIEAISSVMEGGAEAFKRRAKFYKLLELK